MMIGADPAMKIGHIAVVLLCAHSVFLQACAVGRNHTSDAALERVFNQHQADFEALLAEVQADPQLTSIQPRSLVYAGRLLQVTENNLSEVENLGLPRERWRLYHKQLRDLGLEGGVTKEKRTVEFRVDPGSILNGNSYKGYEYRPIPPDHVLSSLDGYRISDRDRDRFGNWIVYKPLKRNWYLYLFVNS